MVWHTKIRIIANVYYPRRIRYTINNAKLFESMIRYHYKLYFGCLTRTWLATENPTTYMLFADALTYQYSISDLNYLWHSAFTPNACGKANCTWVLEWWHSIIWGCCLPSELLLWNCIAYTYTYSRMIFTGCIEQHALAWLTSHNMMQHKC
jgi:hypothetical protein